MATIRANQLSLVNLGLDEKVMQLLEHLFITLQLLSCWRLARQGGETKLSMTDVGQLTGEKKKKKKKLPMLSGQHQYSTYLCRRCA